MNVRWIMSGEAATHTTADGAHRPPWESLPTLFLASRSPRRRALLTEHGIAHEYGSPGLDDSELEPPSFSAQVSPAHWVSALAYMKAAAKARELGPREHRLVLGADTTCVKLGRVLGTPVDADDARRILRELAGGEHEVITGVALVDSASGRRELFFDRSIVTLGELDAGQIESYITTGAWAGKAGAYNLTERLAAGWPLKYSGDPTNIVGLPMRALTARLARLNAAAASSPTRSG